MVSRTRDILLCALFVAACGKPPEPGADKQVAASKAAEPGGDKAVGKAGPPEEGKAPAPVVAAAPAEVVAPPVVAAVTGCDAKQAEVSQQADERAKPWSIAQHLSKNFPDRKVSWLMKAGQYETYVVKTAAKNFGRCDDSGCYLFAAPTSLIAAAVEKAKKGDGHDAAVIGRALGLPAKNFEGPLRMMTLDLSATGSCVRLPVDADPGVWKCKGAEDKDCFKFGGYTSGNVPEVMVINAPVDKAVVTEIP